MTETPLSGNEVITSFDNQDNGDPNQEEFTYTTEELLTAVLMQFAADPADNTLYYRMPGLPLDDLVSNEMSAALQIKFQELSSLLATSVQY